ncbi:hypothetical protein ACSBR2_034340 [Camellia fascicularis]
MAFAMSLFCSYLAHLIGVRILQFLNFLQARVRELNKIDHANHTITVLLVGIPNVGKSALANSLRHIGRISAAEKEKLKHTTMNPLLGETKDISSLELPLSVCVYHVINEVLPLEIPDAEVHSKLALTGVINDCLIREAKLAQYFLAILNLSDEYKQWSKLSTTASEKLSDDKVETSVNSELGKRRKQYATDHTQTFLATYTLPLLILSIANLLHQLRLDLYIAEN